MPALPLLLALALAGCSDDDGPGGDASVSTPDKSVTDASFLPDGYKLYSCPTPGAACNAHDPCAINPICGQDKLCRPTALQNCDDGLACTTDQCMGQGLCQNTPKPGNCAVAIRVYGNVTCEQLKKKADAGGGLDAAVSSDAAGSSDAAAAWFMSGDAAGPDAASSPDAAGSDAGPGDAGPDLGTPSTIICCFDHGDRNPKNACEECVHPSGDAGVAPDAGNKAPGSYWSPANGGYCDDGNACTKDDYCQTGVCRGTDYTSQCADSYACTLDLCDGKGGCLGNTLRSDYCLINATCYKAGAMHPSGTCQTCDPKKSQSAWSSVSNTCLIDNKCYAKGAKNPVGCGECVPATSTTAWTVTGTTCCLISGKAYKAGDLDPTKCSTCDPTKSGTSWTPLTGKCLISGTCYISGDKHPEGCAECKPSQNATSWTVTKSTHCVVSGSCVPKATSVKACGACGVACNSGETCVGGKCTCGTQQGTVGGGPVCASGQSCSKGACVNLPPGTLGAPFTLDFELDNGQLTGTKDWEWGKISTWSPTSNCDSTSSTVPPKKGNSGMGVWATKVNDCYSPLGFNGNSCSSANNNAESILTLKVKIPGTWTKATLTFYQWYDIFLDFDWTEIRVDGTVAVQTCTGSKPSPPGWTKRTVDLSKYAGKIISVTFHLLATKVVQYSGWYIDDMSITGS